MDSFPKNLIDHYLKACTNLKKIERVVFKRFVSKDSVAVQEEFASLAKAFEHAEIYQYAAMCHMGVAKCDMATGNVTNECQSYLKAARNFRRAHATSASLHLRSCRNGEFLSGALRCYAQALERCPDESALKAAIIREMTTLQPHYEDTSSFSSPAHCIYELELAAHVSLQQRDFRTALQQLDDIVDNICERKSQALYVDLLGSVEVLRLLLLVLLNLPPARQSPSHIKLIEFYYQVGDLQLLDSGCSSSHTGADLPLELKETMGEIVLAWHENKFDILKLLLQQLAAEFRSLHEAQRLVIRCICEQLDKDI